MLDSPGLVAPSGAHICRSRALASPPEAPWVSRPLPRRFTRTAFTLIELLVVIAIIAILAAILFPVFARARARAKQTLCLGNLKPMGTAARLYVDDYDGLLVPCGIAINVPGGYEDSRFTKLLEPYIKDTSIFVCPSDNLDRGKLRQMAISQPYPTT